MAAVCHEGDELSTRSAAKRWKWDVHKYCRESEQEFLCAARTSAMLSSFMASVNEFFITGLFSLAILAGMVRASLAQICCFLEWNVGVPVFILGAFVIGIVLGDHLYHLFFNRWGSCCREDRWDEEMVLSFAEMNTVTSSKVRLRASPVFWGGQSGGIFSKSTPWKETMTYLDMFKVQAVSKF